MDGEGAVHNVLPKGPVGSRFRLRDNDRYHPSSKYVHACTIVHT